MKTKLRSDNPPAQQYIRFETGFSLMELFVTVSIVGILSTIALPNYTNYVERARRADGYQALTAILQAQERHFVNNYKYTKDLTELGYSVSAGLLTQEENYRITATRCGQGEGNALERCVMLTAVAMGGQGNDGDITINSRGQKSLGSYAYWPER